MSRDADVYGPMRRGNTVTLGKITSVDNGSLDYSNLKLSLKSFLSPLSEVVVVRENGEEGLPQPTEKSTVVFGVRPCDARAVLSLDKVFEGDTADPFYSGRRRNTTIIARACSDPRDTCFCTSLGGSPSGKEGADVICYDLDDSLLFEASTEKGTKLMEDHSSAFGPVEKTDLKIRDDSAARAEKKLTKIDVGGMSEKLVDVFESPVWEKFYQTCLGCGICTFMCPTCHCFAFYDDKIGSIGERVRCWDSCQYSAFTMEASGHNPRATGGDRVRQRIMHKFSYFVDNFDETACVGCGRCVASCPVNLDLREMIQEIREEE